MERKNMLAYERLGNQASDTTLVFLHGSTMTRGGMLPVAEQFADYNCIVFDLTAHGESGEEEPEEAAVFAEDVEYSVQQLQEKKEISGKLFVLGYSMGGAITCELAIRNRLALSGIVFLSSGADLKHYTPMVEQLKAMPVEEFRTKDILPALFGSDIAKEDADRIMELFLTTKTEDATGYGDLMASNRYDALARCAGITVPAMLVHGSEDKVVLPGAAVETWKAIPGSQLLMIPYRGHGAIYEDPALVRDKIMAFLKHN
ncbi:MAG: alpha/beta hydrolase [Blautia sp.]|nr:alpha/beta hydrolase [Blautia sp.]